MERKVIWDDSQVKVVRVMDEDSGTIEAVFKKHDEDLKIRVKVFEITTLNGRRKFGVNWPACGTLTADEASVFANMITWARVVASDLEWKANKEDQ